MEFESSTSAGDEDFGLSVLASTIAHEIRNPLQSIRLQVDAGLQTGLSRDIFEGISAGLIQIEKVVGRMQGLAHQYDLNLVSVNLCEVLDSIFKCLNFWLQASGVEARTNIFSESPPIVQCDRELIEQVLLNLITNSIQSIEGGGKIEVQIAESEGGWRIQIIDTGRGMSKETLSKFGIPFFTTKASGSGLGVAFCKSIVSLHEGTLVAESEVGRGTVVTVELPKERRKLGAGSC